MNAAAIARQTSLSCICLLLIGSPFIAPPVMAQDTNPANEARVLEVTASPSSRGYTFSVTIASPDTGCDRYADWWEVATPEGELLYRRVLLHSHVSEQPFTRSGGPVEIAGDRPVIIRTHMHPGGYSVNAFSGTVDTGFTATTLDTDFAPELATQAPLPTSCAF